MRNRSILCISDLHFPYNHGDVIAFLAALKKRYKPDRVISLGDEVDWHSISFHDHDPDLFSPSDELKTSINRLKPLYELFPSVDVIESNHGSLVYRRQKHHGLPRSVLKSYRQILEAPRGWKWHDTITLRASNGELIHFCHGKQADVTRLSRAMGISVVQGHYHERFKVEYWSPPQGGLRFGLQTGCLIEASSMAFAYARINPMNQIIGTAVIVEGHPILEPMIMDKNGRWVGELRAHV